MAESVVKTDLSFCPRNNADTGGDAAPPLPRADPESTDVSLGIAIYDLRFTAPWIKNPSLRLCVSAVTRVVKSVLIRPALAGSVSPPFPVPNRLAGHRTLH
jgi:hypothetical protein